MRKTILRHQGGAAITLVAAMIAACGRGAETPRTAATTSAISAAIAPAKASDTADTSPELPADARVSLDSGNALYRAKRYADALVQYRLTARRAPGDPTAYYGIYMVAEATKNRALADTASAALTARGALAPMPHPLPKGSSK
jgi:hypothetical protein